MNDGNDDCMCGAGGAKQNGIDYDLRAPTISVRKLMGSRYFPDEAADQQDLTCICQHALLIGGGIGRAPPCKLKRN